MALFGLGREVMHVLLMHTGMYLILSEPYKAYLTGLIEVNVGGGTWKHPLCKQCNLQAHAA